jgi:hypothetical protein
LLTQFNPRFAVPIIEREAGIMERKYLLIHASQKQYVGFVRPVSSLKILELDSEF